VSTNSNNKAMKIRSYIRTIRIQEHKADVLPETQETQTVISFALIETKAKNKSNSRNDG
jgi:hypothetical protein